MNKLQVFIEEIERKKLPCRYTVYCTDEEISVSAMIEGLADDNLLKCSVSSLDYPTDIVSYLQALIPYATICQIGDKIYIDNLM